MTEQMSLKRGLHLFGEKGAEAVVSEMQQLDYQKVILPKHTNHLTHNQCKQALQYLMYLKEKRNGKIKAQGCADGRKQRVYKSKHETSSPTISTEALFLTSLINAREGCVVVNVDIPGAFMHADIDEQMAELLVCVDPEKYGPYLTFENGKKVLYVELKKALYGMLQAALLFWENLSGFLVNELG